mmetsp:Transcript_99032/g.266086  ORF Transcript_99032/g.266086 Transcript_99032/m.266086 type:complete len:415 (-) Transcript_99032:64-1308(-)
MAVAALAYWQDAHVDLNRAASGLHRFLDQHRRLYWRRPPWRGVNLGGWLLLEPGPSAPFFERLGPQCGCEWSLLKSLRLRLGDEGAAEEVRAHRKSFVSEADISQIRALGMNAVRIPLGYWVVTGPTDGDLFVGPGLEHLDRVLGWCQAHGLQAVLDLHGAPGGESGERPSGHERRAWRWELWRFDESLAALRVLAGRYRGHPAVTGISVCNEPSEAVPSEALCEFYDRAVTAIRGAGMPADQVAIVLPVYRTERLDEVWRTWSRRYDGFVRHTNVVFDLHVYHCFGPWWQRQNMGTHLRMVKRHRKILRRVPAVVGEWSLCLPKRAYRGDDREDEDAVTRAFAAAQLEAYGQASHGWFFWTWRDSPQQHPGWDCRVCFQRGWLSKAQLEPPPPATPCSGAGDFPRRAGSLGGC